MNRYSRNKASRHHHSSIMKMIVSHLKFFCHIISSYRYLTYCVQALCLIMQSTWNSLSLKKNLKTTFLRTCQYFINRYITHVQSYISIRSFNGLCIFFIFSNVTYSVLWLKEHLHLLIWGKFRAFSIAVFEQIAIASFYACSQSRSIVLLKLDSQPRVATIFPPMNWPQSGTVTSSYPQERTSLLRVP